MERLVCISANGRWLSSADRVGAAGSLTQDMPTVRCTGVPLCTAPQAPHRRHRTAGTGNDPCASPPTVGGSRQPVG